MNSNEYMRQYMNARYHRRRDAFIQSRGGRCGLCDSVERLEIDHLIPADKSFNLGKELSTGSEVRVQAELAKCWVLCHACHMLKTRIEGRQRAALRRAKAA